MNQYSFNIHLKHRFGKVLTGLVLTAANRIGAERLSANAAGSMWVGRIPCRHFFRLQNFSLWIFFQRLVIKSHLKMRSSAGIKSKCSPVLP